MIKASTTTRVDSLSVREIAVAFFSAVPRAARQKRRWPSQLPPSTVLYCGLVSSLHLSAFGIAWEICRMNCFCCMSGAGRVHGDDGGLPLTWQLGQPRDGQNITSGTNSSWRPTNPWAFSEQVSCILWGQIIAFCGASGTCAHSASRRDIMANIVRIVVVVVVVLGALYSYASNLDSIKNVLPILSIGLVPGFSVDEIPDLTGKVRETAHAFTLKFVCLFLLFLPAVLFISNVAANFLSGHCKRAHDLTFRPPAAFRA